MLAGGSRKTLLTPSFAEMNRRRLLACMASGTAGLLLSRSAAAAQVAANDPRIETERVVIGAEWGKLDCYLARPKIDAASLPGVIVAHDRLGLTPHFEDVARRFAAEGVLALAPDYASRFGG